MGWGFLAGQEGRGQEGQGALSGGPRGGRGGGGEIEFFEQRRGLQDPLGWGPHAEGSSCVHKSGTEAFTYIYICICRYRWPRTRYRSFQNTCPGAVRLQATTLLSCPLGLDLQGSLVGCSSSVAWQSTSAHSRFPSVAVSGFASSLPTSQKPSSESSSTKRTTGLQFQLRALIRPDSYSAAIAPVLAALARHR